MRFSRPVQSLTFDWGHGHCRTAASLVVSLGLSWTFARVCDRLVSNRRFERSSAIAVRRPRVWCRSALVVQFALCRSKGRGLGGRCRSC